MKPTDLKTTDLKTSVLDRDLIDEVVRLGDLVRDLAKDTASDAKDYVSTGAASVEATVRSNPTQSLIIAGAAGFVLGLLLTHRSD